MHILILHPSFSTSCAQVENISINVINWKMFRRQRDVIKRELGPELTFVILNIGTDLLVRAGCLVDDEVTEVVVWSPGEKNVWTRERAREGHRRGGKKGFGTTMLGL